MGASDSTWKQGEWCSCAGSGGEDSRRAQACTGSGSGGESFGGSAVFTARVSFPSDYRHTSSFSSTADHRRRNHGRDRGPRGDGVGGVVVLLGREQRR